ncbi:MAG: hypothetical protein ACYCPW_02130 [Nitrososphaerales archaeon]
MQRPISVHLDMSAIEYPNQLLWFHAKRAYKICRKSTVLIGIIIDNKGITIGD